ncbi:MAG TPA: hypothetical protein VK208_02950 [Pyrinomonadaceae bacterium]|nr:hypothetical protein [Pyrinomonadaceae bacterium]
MNDKEEFEQIKRLLGEITDNQKAQLELHAESLSIQKQQFQVFVEQQEKTQRIQERAEAIQERSAQILNFARRFFPFVLAAIVLLLGYVTWLLWRILR